MKPGIDVCVCVCFFFPREMAPIQTLTGDTNELECLKNQPLHFDTSADRCKNTHSQPTQGNNKRFMYVGRKGNAAPLPGAVRFTFLLRHSPCQCAAQPNMAECSIPHTVRIMISCQANRCLSTMNCWMSARVCVRNE